jgi:hypothetical protein
MNEKIIPESLDAMQVFLSDVSAKGIILNNGNGFVVLMNQKKLISFTLYSLL